MYRRTPSEQSPFNLVTEDRPRRFLDLDADGSPIPGFSLADAEEMYGDSLEQVVFWKQGPDVSKLVGQTIRLRFVLQDADLYAMRFSHP